MPGLIFGAKVQEATREHLEKIVLELAGLNYNPPDLPKTVACPFFDSFGLVQSDRLRRPK